MKIRIFNLTEAILNLIIYLLNYCFRNSLYAFNGNDHEMALDLFERKHQYIFYLSLTI